MRSFTLPALLAAAVLAATFPFIPATTAVVEVPAATPVTIGWTQVLEGGEFILTAPYVVTGTGTLILRNATVWLDMPTPCWGGGGLGSYCQPSIMVNGGRVVIDNSTIDTHKDPGPRLEGYWAIVGEAATLDVRNSVLRHFRILGNQGESLEPSRIVGSTFEDGSQALNFIRGAEVHVEGSTFQRLYYAIGLQDTAGALVRNSFRDIAINGILVQNSIVGMRVFTTLPAIEGNRFENVTQSITNVNSFPNRIVDNEIRGGHRGIVVGLNLGDTSAHLQAPLVEGNRISDVQYGLHVYVNAQSERTMQSVEVEVHGNSFERVSCTAVTNANVRVNIQVHVDATGNWWGRPEGPQPGADPAKCPATRGVVTVAPWLTAPPG